MAEGRGSQAKGDRPREVAQGTGRTVGRHIQAQGVLPMLEAQRLRQGPFAISGQTVCQEMGAPISGDK